MYGAILGDIIGSPYEFDMGSKTKDFPLFIGESHFTDDSVMTLAVAAALLEADPEADDETVRKALVNKMQVIGKRYPGSGYGARFIHWLEDPRPYGSFGNGSAMRVSSSQWMNLAP